MLQPLREGDLLQLQAQFVIPLIIGHMLKGIEPLDEIAEFTLHEMLAEYQSDTAIICIALASQQVAAHCAHMPITQILGHESMRILNDYAPIWIAFNNGHNLDDKMIQRQLENLPEDFETLADLLDATLSSLPEQNGTQAVLCEILGVQAHAYKEFAEIELKDCFSQASGATHQHLGSSQVKMENNVIPFPGTKQAKKETVH